MIIITVVAVVDDDIYYRVYMSSELIHFKFITKCDSLFYYKVRQPFYNKVRQVLLQRATCITNCDNFITKCDLWALWALWARFLLSSLPLARSLTV